MELAIEKFEWLLADIEDETYRLTLNFLIETMFCTECVNEIMQMVLDGGSMEIEIPF